MNITSVLRNTGLQVRHSFFEDGVAIAADGNVTYTVTKADGTTLTSGTATHVTSPHYYKFDLAPQASLNLLTVAWTGVFSGLTQVQTDQIEVVGGYYVTLSELRALPGLADTTAYPNDTLIELRREFEDIAERYCRVAFVPRFARQRVVGNGRTSLLLPSLPNGVVPVLRRNLDGTPAIYTASATDTTGTVTAFTLTNWSVTDFGQIVTDGDTLTLSTYGAANIVFEYEHGLDSPPGQIVKAGKDYIAAKAIENAQRIGRDVLSRTDPSGFTERWSTPDWDANRPTGYLDVDRALNSIGRIPTVV